jgi:hypothetical protein
MVRPGALRRQHAMTRRLPLRRRRAADPVSGAEPPATTPDAEPVATAPSSDVTAVHPVVPAPSAAAGLELQATGTPDEPSFRERSRLRRRLRYLRRVRELGFRDLGGLVFDLHRFGREGSGLIASKLGALAAVDTELRALETVLDDREEYVVLREPGIAACPRCAALHGSDAHFCPNCGLRLDGPQAIAEVGDAPVAAPAGVLPASAPGYGPGSQGAEPQPPTAVEPTPGAVEHATATQPAAEPAAEPPRVPVEQPTTTQPPVEPGAEPGRSTQAP